LYEIFEYFYISLFECFCKSSQNTNIMIENSIRNPINPSNFKIDDIYKCKETF
jgi:hypothetical protein